MQSRTVDGSIVLFGDVYTSGGKPVMLSLLLNPQNKSGDILNYAVITSAYGRRTNNLQSLMDNSRIYYINENKNRTEEWLQALGLQLPSAVTKLGSIAKIADLNSKVNRITEKKSDIRYSRELETIEELKQQNELPKKQVDYWHSQTAVTVGERGMAEKFRRMALKPGKGDTQHAPQQLIGAVTEFCEIPLHFRFQNRLKKQGKSVKNDEWKK